MTGKRKHVLLTVFIVIAVIVGIIAVWYSIAQKNKAASPLIISVGPKKLPTNYSCLADNEYAETLRQPPTSAEKQESPRPISVHIKDKESKKEKFTFIIENVDYGKDWMTQVHKCGTYVLRTFNFDYNKGSVLPNFKIEIWRYRYNGNGEKIAEESTFRIDETETHIALIRSWYGEPKRHALVIKNLKTMEDEYVITLKELVEKYGIEPATIQLSHWYKNIFRFEVLNDENSWFELDFGTKKLEKTN